MPLKEAHTYLAIADKTVRLRWMDMFQAVNNMVVNRYLWLIIE